MDFISSDEIENFILSSARLRSSSSPSTYFTCSSWEYSYQPLGVAHFLFRQWMGNWVARNWSTEGKKRISKPHPINPANIGGFLTTNRVIKKIKRKQKTFKPGGTENILNASWLLHCTPWWSPCTSHHPAARKPAINQNSGPNIQEIPWEEDEIAKSYTLHANPTKALGSALWISNLWQN